MNDISGGTVELSIEENMDKGGDLEQLVNVNGGRRMIDVSFADVARLARESGAIVEVVNLKARLSVSKTATKSAKEATQIVTKVLLQLRKTNSNDWSHPPSSSS